MKVTLLVLGALLSSSSAAAGVSGVWSPRPFETSNIASSFPTDWNGFPKSLRGVLWLDQKGLYSNSTFSLGAGVSPDGAVSFAGADWDTAARTFLVNTFGPGWSWFNSKAGYKAWSTSVRINFKYTFKFNADYTHAQIVGRQANPFGVLEDYPVSLANYTMDWQPTSAETTKCRCHSATDCSNVSPAVEDKIACAPWKRTTRLAELIEAPVYYGYWIIDEQGKPVEPYFSVYKNWAASQADGYLLGNGTEIVGDWKASAGTAHDVPTSCAAIENKGMEGDVECAASLAGDILGFKHP